MSTWTRGVVGVMTCLIACLSAVGAEVTANQKTEFLKRIDGAAAPANLAGVKTLYEWKGASETDKDTNLNLWKMQFDWCKKNSAHIQPALFLPLDDKAIDTSMLKDAREGRLMNGKLYRTNLPVVGFVKVLFSSEGSSTAMLLPVGQEPEGALMIACAVPSSDTPSTASLSAKVDGFVHRVETLCAQKDLEGMKYLYDWSGVAQETIDWEVSSWEHAFSNQVYVKTEFISIGDASASKKYNPATIARMTDGYAVNGKAYQPNLPVLGFVISTFQASTATPGMPPSGSIRPVGLASDGTIRFIQFSATSAVP